MTNEPVAIANAEEPERPDIREGLAHFVKRSHRKLERQLSRQLPRHVAGDVLQTAYEKLLKRPPKRKIRNFRRFFGHVLKKRIYDWIGQEQRRRHLDSQLMLDGDLMRVPSAEECVTMAQAMEAQLALLGKQDSEALQAFELVRVHELTVQQAAEVMKLSRHQVSRRVCRVLLRLETFAKVGEPK